MRLNHECNAAIYWANVSLQAPSVEGRLSPGLAGVATAPCDGVDFLLLPGNDQAI